MSRLHYVPHDQDFVVSSNAEVEGLRSSHRVGGAWLFTPKPIAGDSGGNAYLFGRARIGENFVLGPQAIPAAPVDITGLCAVVERKKGLLSESVVVRSDFMGFMPLYCFNERGLCLVSNRLHLMASILAKRGMLQFDEAALAMNMLSDSVFWGQAVSDNMLVKGVRMLRPYERVEIKRDGTASIVGGEPESMRGSLSSQEYWRLIRAGADDVIANIRAIMSSSEYGRIVLPLSGGRDSRAVLAGVLAAGAKDKVHLYTTPLPGDTEVATGLAQHFGMLYDQEQAEKVTLYTPESALRQRSSYLFGVYHDWNTLFVGFPEYRDRAVRLMGGAGETYRSYFYGFNPGTMVEPYDYKALKRTLLNNGFRNKATIAKHKGYINPIIETEALERFHLMFKGLSGRSVGEKINRHYFIFRNRLHFGAEDMMQASDVWHPLISPSLLRAALNAPEEVVSSGRIMFDLTSTLHEEAAHLPYDKPGADFLQVQFHRPSKYDGVELALLPDPELLRVSARATKTQVPLAHKDLEFLRRDVRECLESLRAEENLSRYVLADLDERLDALSVNRKFFRRWYSRISNIADIRSLGSRS
jgi:hypothetical protein